MYIYIYIHILRHTHKRISIVVHVTFMRTDTSSYIPFDLVQIDDLDDNFLLRLSASTAPQTQAVYYSSQQNVKIHRY